MRSTSLTLALAAALAIGCSEQSNLSTAPPDNTMDPAFTIDNAPAVSGIVIRSETFVAVGWTDEKEGTFVLIGFDPVEYCGGTYDFDVVPVQQVMLSNGRGTLSHIQGEGLRTSVWPFAGFSCALVNSVPPLAAGLSNLVNTDNDYNVDGRSMANAFGFRAHGTLTRPDGTDAVFSGHVNYTVNGNTGFRANSRISLH